MIPHIIPAILIYSVFVLLILMIIDLRTRLLPNKFVLQFLFCGIAFHILTGMHYTTPSNMVIAMILSGGMMLTIRAIGNKIYKTDTLGLGDVKLIGAAGLWLGTDSIFLAISLGAIAGIIHGVIVVMWKRITTDEKVNFATFSIPAGPGFIIGIILMGIIKFHSLPTLLQQNLL